MQCIKPNMKSKLVNAVQTANHESRTNALTWIFRDKITFGVLQVAFATDSTSPMLRVSLMPM